ncbi:putative Transitional endoplasmic reticulum ATPase [Trypanosoma theileri]|uniref:Putative Transitional endoplasmic reticulum ATPase n=1 Tax=Trypanosoma theileri TaxID=67003 RepID=A0A1X0P1J4_9TRYP|nr:putative Transitional endoplasmic reticulum ATPase [Trypanosoma theileri]ORC90824.1 putative Transitional endoplasmic reticulum ATPase [Trypanosoma theileri]
MAPKKARFKPPIRPNADGTGFVRTSAGSKAETTVVEESVPQRRGREGFPGTEGSLPAQVPPAPSKTTTKTSEERKGTSIEFLLQPRSDSSLPSNEARLSPSSFKNLGILSGAILHIKSSVREAYCEAFLSSSCHSQTILLADEMSAALRDKQVIVSVVKNPSVMEPISQVDVEITRDVGNDSTPPEIPFLQVRAAFRRQYQHRLVYNGMRAMIRIATHPFYVEVVRCIPCVKNEKSLEKENKVTLGMLMDNTVIRDGAHDVNYEDKTPEENLHIKENSTLLEHVLVIGEAGTGKTQYLQNEGQDATTLHRRHVEIISVEELPQGDASDVTSSTVLREAFTRAKIAAPSTVLIDDLHLICGTNPSSMAGSLWAMNLVAAVLCEELDNIKRQQLDVRVIASAPSAEAVSRSLLTRERFSNRVVLLTPGSAEERLKCLKTIMDKQKTLSSTHISEETLKSVAEQAHGFTQRDLAHLIEVGIVENFTSTGSIGLSDSSLQKALTIVRPSSLKQFEVSVPQVTWGDIGGSESAKKTLQDCVAWCLGKQSWVFRKFKLSPPKGVLLYGPPGCSKTMLAKALANESKMNFISVKGPEVFSKWVGDSEKAVRDIFTRARAVAPCVVFIDELDGMCSHRGQGGVSDRVISQFLTELDGLPAALDESSEALVFVAATNRPDNIDTAVLRPGRIDRKVYVGLPDLSERKAIVEIHFARIPVAPDLNAEYVASRTEGYSGAEVVAVVKEAAFLRVTEDAKAAYITHSDIDAALQKVKPRISQRDVEWYKRWAMGGG